MNFGGPVMGIRLNGGTLRDSTTATYSDAILLVPAIFGIMFNSDLLRASTLSLCIALVVTYFALYAWARVHPTSTGAHLLQLLHIGPPKVGA